MYEMLFVRSLKPNLNVQGDSIRAKVFLKSFYNFFTIFAPSYVNSLHQNRFKCCNLQDLFYIFLDNVVMNTPNRRISSLVFTVLTFRVTIKLPVRVRRDLTKSDFNDLIGFDKKIFKRNSYWY